MGFLTWHYTAGITFYIQSWLGSFEYLANYFSLFLLLKTLFSPWKKLVDDEKTTGFDFGRYFQRLTFNIVSRCMGALVRISLIFAGTLFLVLMFLGGVFGFVFWIILPLFGIPVYLKYKKQPQHLKKHLVEKLAVANNKLETLFDNNAGRFVLSHVGLSLEEILANSKPENLDFTNSHADSYMDLLKFALEKEGIKESFLNTKELKKEDLLMSALWWEQKTNEETKIGDNYTHGPGLALELLYGYTPTLNKYSVDLSLPQDYSHHLIGRENVVSRMERSMTSGNSVCVTGLPGVGKKTVVLEFAKRAKEGKLGHDMAFRRILELDYNSLLSISKDINEKKTILSRVLNEAASAGNIILMIRDVHRLTRQEIEGVDFTDIFEGHLARRDLKIIAVATPIEYERFIAPNLRLRKHLEVIEVTSPTRDEAFEILVEAAMVWESRRGILLQTSALRKLLDESDKYITEVPFPEKTLELLDALVSYIENQQKSVATADDASLVLAEKTGISFARLTGQEKVRLGNLEEIIHERLVNQENAIKLIARSLRARTVGVTKENKPLGSFLFLGPTGVGKTETAKVLASVYYGSPDAMLRFDMAEYAGSEGFERLVGSVAKNHPGSLTGAIKNKPASLLLLDEFEKATQEIYNLFLTLLDEGMMTDAFGKRINGSHLFIVATSNAAAEYVRQLVSDNIAGEELQKKVIEHVLQKEIFSPELLNRFDGVVVYEPLDKEHLIKVAEHLLDDLSKRMREKNIDLQITEELCRKVAEDGFDPAFGARPMKRVVDLTLGDLLGKAILKEEIKPGDKIKILSKDGKEDYAVEKV